jgi:catechol 2,3-dioxygenase-like lactoylglutathione lyase family enzyme
MATIDHVTLRVHDLDAGLQLYDQVFALLPFAGERRSGEIYHEWNDFGLAAATARHPATSGAHVGFAADSRQQVDRWWDKLVAAGYAADGEPGPRPEYGSDYYGGFLRDPDGNSIEAVHHGTVDPRSGVIDHVWIRVTDLAATKRFYSAVAAAVGLQARDLGDRLQLISRSGTFSVLAGSQPTRNLHLAVGVENIHRVDDFHAAGLRAGGRDNGAPGLRPGYHAGYHGAYLLDPDGNNLEAVFHDPAARGGVKTAG